MWLTTHLLERRRPGCSTAAAKALTVLAAALVAAAIGVVLVAAVPWLAKHVLPTALQAGHWQNLAPGRYWGSALVALVIIVAWGRGGLAGRWLGGRVVLVAAAAAVLAGCVLLTVIQASYWQDTTTALEHTLIVAPDNPAAENNLGVTMWERAQGTRGAKPESEEQIAEYRKKAIEHWRNAVRIRPQFSDALNNLGFALATRRGVRRRGKGLGDRHPKERCEGGGHPPRPPRCAGSGLHQTARGGGDVLPGGHQV